jgi:transcriptional regulator with XRE-family HTH domain
VTHHGNKGGILLLKLRINERLRELRIKSGYTQSQIAKILNIDRSTYSYYEIGKTMPDVSILMTLAKIFNISLEELLSDENGTHAVADGGARRDYVSGKKNSSRIYELSGRERELVGAFRACSEAQRERILQDVRDLMNRPPDKRG